MAIPKRIGSTIKNKKIPKGRKLIESYKPHRHYSIDIPLPLFSALKEYNKPYSRVLDMAITELKKDWDHRRTEEFARKLRYNPPPASKRNVRVNIRIINELYYEFLKELIYDEYPYVINTSDFIRRALSWFLREKGYLKKI
jgi:hypothetical protein